MRTEEDTEIDTQLSTASAERTVGTRDRYTAKHSIRRAPSEDTERVETDIYTAQHSITKAFNERQRRYISCKNAQPMTPS